MQKPMRTIWHSLLWKEWHEHKWNLLGLTLILLVMPLILSINAPQTTLVTVSVTLLCYGILAGLFTGMRTAAGENQRGTMPFLQSLPVSMKKPAVMKLLLSWFTVSVPMLALVGIGYAYLKAQQYHPLDLANVLDWSSRSGFLGSGEYSSLAGYSATLSIMGILFATSLLLWMAAIGVNRSDEIRAGAIGFLVIALIWVALALSMGFASRNQFEVLVQCLSLPLSAAPGGAGHLFNFSQEFRVPVELLALTALISHATVLSWYICRFGRPAVRPARTWGGKAIASTNHYSLARPRHSPLTAMVWKQVYETGPLCLGTAGAVILLTCLYFMLDSDRPIHDTYGEVLGGITLGVGWMVTLVVGMGVFLEDLKPPVNIFWRSRPINTTQWFFVKFFTGLMVLIATFGSLLLIALFLPGDRPLLEPRYQGVQAAFFALIFTLIYTLAMASYCLGQHPIIAAMASLAVLFCGTFGAGYLIDQWVPADSQLIAALTTIILAQLAATLVAWLAVRNNWGWHR